MRRAGIALAIAIIICVESFAASTTTRTVVQKECVLSEPRPPATNKALAAALAAIFVPKLIEKGLDGLGAALKRAGEPDKVQLSGSAVLDLYVPTLDKKGLEPNPGFGCVVIVHVNGNGAPQPPTTTPSPTLSKLVRAKILNENELVSFAFEGRIERSSDLTAFWVVPTHFEVFQFAGKRQREEERAYVATISLHKPISSVDGEAIAVANVDLGRYKKGGKLDVGLPFPLASNLMPWPQLGERSSAAWKAAVEAGTPAIGYMPITFSTTITETADGNAFLKSLGEILQANKAEAAKEVSKELLPAEREKADEAAESEIETLRTAEESAYTAALEALKAFNAVSAEGTDKEILRAKLDRAKRLWQRSCGFLAAAGIESEPAGRCDKALPGQ